VRLQLEPHYCRQQQRLEPSRPQPFRRGTIQRPNVPICARVPYLSPPVLQNSGECAVLYWCPRLLVELSSAPRSGLQRADKPYIQPFVSKIKRWNALTGGSDQLNPRPHPSSRDQACRGWAGRTCGQRITAAPTV
jgi:hypothetical protein